MTTKMRSRAGLIARILWLLIAVCVGIIFSNTSYAQATPPACDVKILDDCTFNSADTTWMMTSHVCGMGNAR
jgi:hypothetical protein